MSDTMQTQPAVIIGAISAVVTAGCALLVAFGLPLTEAQTAAILAFVGTCAPLVAAFAIKRKVWAPASVDRIAGVESGEGVD